MKFVFAIIFALFFICAVQSGPVEKSGEKCRTACHLLAEPTCGFNGKCYRKFGNSCVLKASACNGQGNFEKVAMEECLKPEAPSC